MFRVLCLILVSLVGFFLAFFPRLEAAITYTPGNFISMTGSNESVYFDVADEIYDAPSIVPRPVLDTSTSTFSGAFYLSGAGWIDFSTGSYSVSLDCGIQSLGDLTAPCVLDGVAYGELVGDISFLSRDVEYDPTTGRLSGTASTFIGEYDFSGIILPLFPTRFIEGESVSVHHEKSLTLAKESLHSGPNTWRIHFQPIGGSDILYGAGPYDLSHASIYRLEIIDPDDGTTVIDDFEVQPGIPSPNLDPATPLTLRQVYCSNNPISPLCPDGSTLLPSLLLKTGVSPIANGVDTYGFTLSLRDRYGNPLQEGTIRIDYDDRIREAQILGPFPYSSYGSGQAIVTTGVMNNYLDGRPSTGELPANIGPYTYTLRSIAPTNSTDTLALSGIIYKDTSGTSIDITLPEWRDPLTFDPWYTTSLSAGPMVIGSGVEFTTTYTRVGAAPVPASPSAIYDIVIGANTLASFDTFASSSSIACTKYILMLGAAECDWPIGLYDPVIIATEALTFSGIYNYSGFEPPPEEVTYKSYITYEALGKRVIYPSSLGPLGNPVSSVTKMKVIGQHNLRTIGGIQTKNSADIWNSIRKNIALMTRNRSSYGDVSYIVYMGDTSVDMTDFTVTTPEKRTIIALGGDITIEGDISGGDTPLALIALADDAGNGGHIHIDPSVTDIRSSLFASKSIHSSGNNQLAIYGTVVSYNSVNNVTCPYHDPACADPTLYNIENLRQDYITFPGNPALSLGGKYASIPLVIEYDGRVLSDPPPGLER